MSSPLSDAEPVGEEGLVDAFDRGVQSEILLIVFAGDRKRDLDKRRARRRHAGGAER